ncbi:MAG TPA: hypothetical protein VG755_21345 [Nannocystaceae bacterium]|nr:hypothetical protein [Nannocystaceae bacterium]
MLLGSVLALALAPDPTLVAAPLGQHTADLPKPPLRRRAIGLGIASGVLGVAWFGMKMVGTANDPVLARDIEAGRESGFCIELCYVGPMFNLAATPVLIGTAGLLGGSMHAHGRRLALDGRRSRRQGVIAASVGGGLLGAAAVGLGLGIGLQRLAPNETTMVASRELGWWSGAALGVAGAALLGLGHGIIRGNRERKHGIDVAFAPMFGNRITGLSIAGRF